MNDVDRLDRWLPARLADLVGTDTADYLDDVLGTVATTRQRPAWSFPGRWLPMAEFVGRPSVALPVPWRPIAAVLVLAALLVATAAVYVGSRPRVPAPFGPAANGRIAYVGPDGGIWTAEPDQGDARQIIAGSGRDTWLSFSPDGRRIAFARQDRKDFSRIMVANADGSDLHEVTTEPLWLLDALAWAPDGRSIALGANIGGRPSIAVADADGSGMTTLDLGMAVGSPAWRPPDGGELVVRGHPVTGVDLFVVDADGGDLRPLHLERSGAFYSAFDLLGPTWSPDGSRIAYHTPETAELPFGDQPAHRVHVVNADGSDDRVMPSGVDADESSAAWSPDGERLAVVRREGADWSIAIVRADAGSTGMDVGPSWTEQGGDGISVQWSPDGSSLLAHDQGTGRVWSIDPTTGDRRVTLLTQEPPAWQRLYP